MDGAAGFLKEHEPPGSYRPGFPGGKASIAMPGLARLPGVKFQACHPCARIGPPEMRGFIRREYPGVAWLFPRWRFWSLVRRYGPPFRMARWRRDRLKKAPGRGIPLGRGGIRAEESRMRAGRPRGDRCGGRQVLYRPIFHWPGWAAWGFIEAEGLPPLRDQEN